MSDNRRAQGAGWSALCCGGIAGSLIALGGCQAVQRHAEANRGDTFTQRAEVFIQALGESGHVVEPGAAFWLLELDHETDTGRAWVGEVRENVLHVTGIECAFNPCVLRLTAEGRYAHFTSPRKIALMQAFTTSVKFVSGRDYPAGGGRSFSGHGRVFVDTVTFRSDREIEHLSGWISDTSAPVADVHENDLVPIELAIPWVISRYYAADR